MSVSRDGQPAGQGPENEGKSESQEALERSSFAAMVADRSDIGKQLLAGWLQNFPDIAARAEAWRAGSAQFFIDVRRSEDGQPVLTLTPENQEDLRWKALPDLFRRVNEEGGSLVSYPCVDEALVPMLRTEFAKFKPRHKPAARAPKNRGLELYESGALRGKQLVEARRGERNVTAVVVADRTPESLRAVELFAGISPELARNAQEWGKEAGPGYLVLRADRTGVLDLWQAGSLPVLLREALPSALGEAIAARSPVLLRTELNGGLIEVMSAAVVTLTGGELPAANEFPLAKPEGVEEIPVGRLHFLETAPYEAVRLVNAYGNVNGHRVIGGEIPKWHLRGALRAFRQEDGSVHYLSELAGGETIGARVPAGTWRLQTDEEFEKSQARLNGKGQTRH